MLTWLTLLLSASITFGLCCELKPVENLHVANPTSQLPLGWTAPGVSDLECVRGYEICAASQGEAPRCFRVRNRHIGGYVVTGLQPCREYNVSVVVLGEDSSESQPASLLASTGPAPADSLVVVREGNAKITARWTYNVSSTNCGVRFKLTWCGLKGQASSGCNSVQKPVMGLASHSQQLRFVQFCGAYSVSLQALDDVGRGSDLLKATVEKLPLRAPENLTVTNYTTSFVEVRWGIPEHQLRCQYRVHVEVAFTEMSTLKSIATVFNAGTTSYAMRDRSPCKAYNIAVGFVTSEENVNASTVAFTLPEGDEIFSNASVSNETSSSVSVAWTTVLGDYECVTSYAVCWGEDNSSLKCRDTRDDDFQITGLEPDTTYQVSVEARLGNGLPLDSRKLAAATTSGASGFFSNFMARIFVTLSLLTCMTEALLCKT